MELLQLCLCTVSSLPVVPLHSEAYFLEAQYGLPRLKMPVILQIYTTEFICERN